MANLVYLLCEWCGESVKGRYCSPQCDREASSAHRRVREERADQVEGVIRAFGAEWFQFDRDERIFALTHRMKRCKGCGETFFPKRSDARFCSSKCRQSAYRGRVKESREEE